jgi:hypothetical protein
LIHVSIDRIADRIKRTMNLAKIAITALPLLVGYALPGCGDDGSGASSDAGPDGGSDTGADTGSETDTGTGPGQSGGDLLWAVSAGGIGDDAAAAVATLPDGSVLVAGTFSETAVFGPGEANETELVSAGARDVFLMRLSAEGGLTWARAAGGAGEDAVASLSALADGTCTVAGHFAGAATFGLGEPGETTITSPTVADMFVARYAADGSLTWARRATETPQWSNDVGAAGLEDGGYVAVGEFSEELDLDGDGVELISAGERDLFLARFTAEGALLWHAAAGGATAEALEALHGTPAGAFCVAGSFTSEQAVFGAGEPNETVLTKPPDCEMESPEEGELFVASYGADGALAWAAEGEGSWPRDWGTGVRALGDGSCLLTGRTDYEVVLGQDQPGQITVDTPGFAALYAADGSLAWAVPIEELPEGVAAHDDGASVTGEVDGAGFASRHDGDGTVVWTRELGGIGRGAATCGDGSTVVAGEFHGDAAFGQGEPGEIVLDAVAGDDAFVAKLGP